MRKFFLILAMASTLAVFPAALTRSQEKVPPPATTPVKPPPLAITLPDLRINRLWFAQYVANPDAGPLVQIIGDLKPDVKVLVICDVANGGPTDYISSWKVGFYFDDFLQWTYEDITLNTGGKRRIIYPFGYTPRAGGIHKIRCAIIVPDKAKEYRANNQKEIFYNVVQ